VTSLFPRSVCDLLGLKYEAGMKASLISATREEIPVRVHEVGIKIGKIEFSARVGFSEVENVPHLLGRLDVFDNVKIEFEKDGVKFTSW